jgi:hypothetical protein
VRGVGEHGQPVDAVVISVHRAHDGRDARGAYAPVAVAASHELAFDLAGLPVPVGVADHGLIQVKPVQRHVGRLEAQVTDVGEEGGDETAHQGLLRNRLPGGADVGQVLGEQPALPVDANLEQVVRREAVQHPAEPPLLEHADRPVLDKPGALALFHPGSGLAFEDHAVDPAGPQQHRGGQPGYAAADNDDRHGFARHLRHDACLPMMRTRINPCGSSHVRRQASRNQS